MPAGVLLSRSRPGLFTRHGVLCFVIALLGLGGEYAVAATTTTSTALLVTSQGSLTTTAAQGSAVTLTATVTAGGSQLTRGQVNFCDTSVSYCTDIYLLGTAQLTDAGTAVLRFIPGLGNHRYKAVFAGTTAYASSASTTQTLSVTGTGIYPSLSTISVADGTAAGTYNFAATVAGLGINASSPTISGSLKFLDASNGNAEIASAPLAGGAYSQQFITGQSLPGLESGFMVSGDFNGDGIPDLADGVSSTIWVWLGKGDGTFQNPVSSAAGSAVNQMIYGDFNNDGKTDIAVTNWSTVSILLGNGDGTFQPQKSFAVTANFILVGEFTGDGNLDLAVADNSNEVIRIFAGNGDGTFAEVQSFTYYDTNAMTSGDFNNDGITDLVIGSAFEPFFIYLGAGNGTFSSPLSAGTGYYPASMLAADFNGDGKVDLVSLSADGEGGTGIEVLPGNGDGTFQSSQVYNVGRDGEEIGVGDLNGDGKPDLVMTVDGGLETLMNNGDGTFQAVKRLHISGDFALADWNGDGRPDLAVMDDANSVVLLNSFGSQGAASVTGISIGENGSHQIVASYAGDGNYSSSVSSGTTLLVGSIASLSATSLTFGNEIVDAPTNVQTVTLTNPGSAALTIRGIALTGPEASEFASSNDCAATLAVGASCTIRVRFIPKGVGGAIAAVTLTDNSGTSSQTIALTGTGINTVNTTVTLSPTSLSFGNEMVGAPTDVQTVTLTNTGTGTLTIGYIAATGPQFSSFANSNDCGTSLASHASCTIRVRFIPKAIGPATATLTLIDSGSGSPQSITLTGTGTNTVDTTVSLSATSLAFGIQPVGGETAVQTATLTNTGVGTLTIGAIMLTGPQAVSFMTSNNCGASLASHASCMIRIRFTPQLVGAAVGAITLIDSATGSPQSIALTGTGAN